MSDPEGFDHGRQFKRGEADFLEDKLQGQQCPEPTVLEARCLRGFQNRPRTGTALRYQFADLHYSEFTDGAVDDRPQCASAVAVDA